MKKIDWEEVVAFLDNQPYDRDDGASHRLADALRAGLAEPSRADPDVDWDAVVTRLFAKGGSLTFNVPEPVALTPRPIQYSYNRAGSIMLPPGAPFDGKEVLIELAAGWVQARWEDERSYETQDGRETTGFCWVCLDDGYTQQELDCAKRWMPIPSPAEG